MKVVVVPVHEDNYAYLLIDEASKEALVVDPGVPSTVLEAAKENDVKVTHVLTTHHHWDHADGNQGMVDALPGLVVVGGDDRIQAITHKMSHNDELKVGSLTVKALFTPCHTSGHVLYYVIDSSTPNAPAALFTGDTLFVAGCGRFFEGTGEQMDHALNKVIASLPRDTLVYVGHEYTVANLKFARKVEPENRWAAAKLAEAEALRAEGKVTVPSTIADELKFNPFMRVNESDVRISLGLDGSATSAQVMAELREAKNNYKG